MFNSTLELPDSTGSTVGMMGIGQVFCEIIPSLDGGYVNDMIYNQYDLIGISNFSWVNDATVFKKEVDIRGYGTIKILLKDFDKQEEQLATNKCIMVSQWCFNLYFYNDT